MTWLSCIFKVSCGKMRSETWNLTIPPGSCDTRERVLAMLSLLRARAKLVCNLWFRLSLIRRSAQLSVSGRGTPFFEHTRLYLFKEPGTVTGNGTKDKLQRVICAQRSLCTHACRPTFSLQKSEDTQAAKPAGAGIKCESGHRSRWTDSLRWRRRGGGGGGQPGADRSRMWNLSDVKLTPKP